jgi:myo-inositol-1(or 4)-monophosphatase
MAMLAPEESLRDALEACLRQAGAAALARFRARDFRMETKGAQDFVSQVDRDTEIALIDMLAKILPGARVLGEEFGGSAEGLAWVIDPIDGTSNFVRGLPLWCLSVALVKDGVPVAGAIYDPNADEMFSAIRGGGTRLNGLPVHVATTASLDAALLGLSFSFKSRPEAHHAVLRALMDARGLYRFLGSGALGLAYCAAGRVDGFWEDWMMPWDVAAGLILVTEAGGLVSDYAANDGWNAGNAILASSPAMAAAFGRITGLDAGTGGPR